LRRSSFITRVPFRIEEEIDKDAVLTMLVIDIAERVLLVIVVKLPESQIGRHLFRERSVEVTELLSVVLVAAGP